MRRGARPRVISILVVSAALVVGGALPASAAPATSIAIHGAWGTGIVDVITYKISAPDAVTHDAIEAGVEAWDAGVTSGLAFVEVAGKGTAAEMTIGYKAGGGVIAGSARRTFSGGFITGGKISISGKAFGRQTTAAVLTQVTSHEVGHILGLGHADGDGVMMSPSVDTGSTVLTTCDRNAVVAANHWYLADGDTTPHQPHAPSSPC